MVVLGGQTENQAQVECFCQLRVFQQFLRGVGHALDGIGLSVSDGQGQELGVGNGRKLVFLAEMFGFYPLTGEKGVEIGEILLGAVFGGNVILRHEFLHFFTGKTALLPCGVEIGDPFAA